MSKRAAERLGIAISSRETQLHAVMTESGQHRIRVSRSASGAGWTRSLTVWRKGSIWEYAASLVHAVDRHSNKSALAPQNPRELERLAEQRRTIQQQLVLIEPVRTPTKSLRRRLSLHEIDDLVARYNAGSSLRSLSLEYGVSRSGLRHVLKSEGVTLQEYGITPEEAESAELLYESGLTIRQVVEQLGSSFGTIQRMLHENGVAVRASGIGKGIDRRQRA